MTRIMEHLIQLEEAVAELDEGSTTFTKSGIVFRGDEKPGKPSGSSERATVAAKPSTRPETRLRGASRRGRLKPGTIAKHMGDKAQWVTINGVHVLVNKETGEPVIGPDSLVRQRQAGQRNVDKIFGGKKHGFEVKDSTEEGGEEGGEKGDEGKRDKKGRFTMKHKPTGIEVPMSGVGIESVVGGLASFLDAAIALTATAGSVLLGKLEGAIRQTTSALEQWRIA